MIHCTRCLLALSALAWCSGCGDDHDHEHGHEGEDPAEHACEHAAETGTPVTAAAERSAAPVLAIQHDPYAIAVPASGPGFVRIEAPAEALLFVGTADVVTGLFRDDSTTSEPLEGSPNEFCPDEIPEHFDIDVETGSLTVQLGPSAVSPVWVALTEAAGHAH